MTSWDPADIKAHIDLREALNAKLAGSGELVGAQGLAAPELARFVTSDGTSAPVVIDGPFPESKELLAGYRMIDVDSPERAIEIAARSSAAPGPGGVPMQLPIEVRQVLGRAWRRDVSTGPGTEDLLRELAPQVLGVLVRRYGDFSAAEDAVQEALLAAALHWPHEGVPASPRGWLIQTAVRKLTDQLRSEQARRRREESAARREPPPAQVTGQDDTLSLLLLCCHPALTPRRPSR